MSRWKEVEMFGDGTLVWTDGTATAWIEDDGTLAMGDALGTAVGYLPMDTVRAITGLRKPKNADS